LGAISAPICDLIAKVAKNPGKMGKNGTKNGEMWRFFQGQSAISTSVYATRTEAQTTGVPELTSASRPASSNLLTANSKTDRHFFGCDWDRRVSDRRDMRVIR
jgi:hypothetical protein